MSSPFIFLQLSKYKRKKNTTPVSERLTTRIFKEWLLGFVLLDYHPFFLLQGIPTHFDSATGEPMAIENFVHLISDHINVGRDTGFSLLEMHERLVDREWVAQRPRMARYMNHPISFAMLWKQESKLLLPGNP
jgi:hypothetical protein